MISSCGFNPIVHIDGNMAEQCHLHLHLHLQQQQLQQQQQR